MPGSWRITIDVHDDSMPPGRNRRRLEFIEGGLLSDAVENALDGALLIHDEPGTAEFQITVRPCE